MNSDNASDTKPATTAPRAATSGRSPSNGKKIAAWGCGSVIALFVAMAVVLSIMAAEHEEGWRQVTAINTTDRALQVGVEDEDGEGWSAELVQPGSVAHFQLAPGRYRALVLDEENKVVREGKDLVEVHAADAPEAKDERLFVDAAGEGKYAVVDSHFLYEADSGLGKAIRDSMNQGRPALLDTLPAAEVMRWRNVRSAELLYPGDELPEKVRKGADLYLLRAVPLSASSPEQILQAVVDTVAD